MRLSRSDFLVLLVFSIVMFSVGLAIWSALWFRQTDTAGIRLDRDTALVDSLLEEKLQRYVDISRSAAAAFSMNNHEVDSSEWEKYTSNLEISQDFDGVSSILFFDRVEPEEIDESYENLGVQIPTNIDRTSDNFVVKQITPLDDQRVKSLGIVANSLTDPNVSKLLQTRESTVTEFFYTTTTDEPVFLALSPVFVEGEIVGITAVSFRAETLIYNSLLPIVEAEDPVTIKFSSEPNNEIAVSEALNGAKEENMVHRSEAQIEVEDQTFYLQVEATGNYKLTRDEINSPFFFAVTSVISLSMLIGISWHVVYLGRNYYQLRLIRFKEAVDNSADSIIFTDPQGKVVYANKAASKINGYSQEEIIGASPSLWGGMMSKEFYQNMWETISEKKEVFYGKLKNKRKNGEIYDVELQAIPILDQRGRVKFFVGIEQDISVIQEFEQQKVDFVTITSHQLRTPLTAIKWNLELIEESGGVDEKAMSHFKEIERSNERMIELIEDLLQVSRFERGKFDDLESKKFDLSELVQEVLADHKDNLEEACLTCNSQIEPGIEMKGDRGIFKVAIENLVSNAIKYSGDSKEFDIRLVRVEDASKGNKKVKLEVSDKGIGIPLEQQEHVFNKFFRADNAKLQHVNGSGLGLFIAKSVVESHKGEISFTSSDQGTTFTILLPAL
ncbi:MAG: ATP-binding protein [Candidatus Dojkabacteria bacterium]